MVDTRQLFDSTTFLATLNDRRPFATDSQALAGTSDTTTITPATLAYKLANLTSLTVTGLTVNGNSLLSGTATVSGVFSAQSNATVGGTLGVTSNVTVGGTLFATGNTTLSTLTVNGTSTLAAVNTSGNVRLGGGSDLRISSAAAPTDQTKDAVLFNDDASLTLNWNNADRLYCTSAGGLYFNVSTPSPASVDNVSFQSLGEILSRGSKAGNFFEDRTLAVTNTTNWHGWYATGGTIFLWRGNANAASINPSTGVYTALSDANLKTDVETYTGTLEDIQGLRPVTYKMVGDTATNLGFIAQEVEGHIPLAVVRIPTVDANGDPTEFVGLNDRPIIAALVAAVKELAARVEALENP